MKFEGKKFREIKDQLTSMTVTQKKLVRILVDSVEFVDRDTRQIKKNAAKRRHFS